MKAEDRKPSKRRAVIIGVGILAGLLVAVCILIWVADYVARPHMLYALKQADCTPQAIAARDARVPGDESKSCVLVITATNTKHSPQDIDWEGVGGGPLGGFTPLIRIYSASGSFCYAGVASSGDFFRFRAGEQQDLTLSCALVQHPPARYDMHADEYPTEIVISGQPDTHLPVRPQQ